MARGVTGRLSWVSRVTDDVDDADEPVLAFQFDLGEARPAEEAFRRLVAALTELSAVTADDGGPMLTMVEVV